MNRYPLWKYLLVLAVVLLGILTALPNFYGSAPAIQISPAGDEPLSANVPARISAALETAGTPAMSEFERDGKRFYLFDSIDSQAAADTALQQVAEDDYLSAKTLAPLQPAWLRSLGLEPMSLGLDLRGGVYLLYEVDLAAAIDNRLNLYVDEIAAGLREAGVTRRVTRTDNAVLVEVREADDFDTAQQVVRRIDRDVSVTDRDDKSFLVRMTELQIRERQNFVIEQNMTTFRNRVDALGVAEPVIQRQGLNRIVVQLPGVQDPSLAKEILSATATLEFRLVDEQGTLPGSQRYPNREGGEDALKREIIASGDQIIDASSGFSEGQPAVNIRLDSVGGSNMLKTTQANINKPMAVLFIESERADLDGDGVANETRYVKEIINIANIRGAFSNQFRITGLTSTEARTLSLLLKAGALAAPVYIVGEQTIGPSRGQDNIDRGFQAIQIGFIAVVIFMALYYRVFGAIADLALLTNLVLIVGFLSMLQASLTLPGIAGIVLTVGMAVDANVLIFERIREELDGGASAQSAINAGYEKAFSSIADANITTFIAALVLFLFGTGPVKGFAVTLSIGIVTSMFTAIVGTRAVVNLIYGGRQVERLAV
ncbi:MAG: protein translocase subunit SecD [Pseudomonadota bacterium]